MIAAYRLLRARGWLPRSGPVTTALGYAVMPLVLCLWAAYLFYREGVLARVSWPRRLASVGAATAVLLLFSGTGEPFYYFQF